MLIGLDFDNTLVRSWTAEPLPHARERLAALPTDAKTFIATNQAGPVFRAVLGDPKYPTVTDVAERIAAGLAALDWRPDLLLVCCNSGNDGEQWERATREVQHSFDLRLHGAVVRPYPDWRKPQPGMLHWTMGYFSVLPAGMIFIGDMDSDRQAAEAAGARFVWARDWLAGADLS